MNSSEHGRDASSGPDVRRAHLLVVGPRACGKSTVGRMAAALLGRPFVDLDERALARFDEPTVTAAWRAHGEASWREAEAASLAACLGADEPPAVVALGGGAPTVPAVAAAVASARSDGRAFVAYLECPLDVLEARLEADLGDRPSLTGADPRREIAEVLARREPVYRAMADAVVPAAGEPRSVAEAIVAALLA